MTKKTKTEPTELMVVNDSPGECRIAILQENHLEELFTERTATATNVGNIYKGKVRNVESAIQAAFIDYGQKQNGFLHISDLHPRYFPGRGQRTEQVGKKIPRRERPPIQEALRPGAEILVQVLKEGIGTKGPTLTSYLSIPGRLLVVMPDMDRVGVSRRVEDEQERREMRKTLSALELPEGFGFILRTAGLGETKAELKRDVAYLMRLWKEMEKRLKNEPAPCELYSESDLLIRTIRDVLRPSIKGIVVDSESAYRRAGDFLRVVAPRSAPMVYRYPGKIPIFHAYDIERQIELIHGHEVPLPSGGKLVIDQTEALVAIDVNSGRSRSARDSETNAFRTNCEAVDEICRQLRLRDLGGLVINDLIDMRFSSHRRKIEERFHENLKRDRAKTTILRISDFGILEMTRQRMRPSLYKSHYVPCTHCNGRGDIRSPDTVGADAIRHVDYLLQNDRVSRVEIVCSPRVASVLLSAKRRELVEIEDLAHKSVDVRVSDAISDERVDFYAYDDRNADIDVTQLPAPRPPSLVQLESGEVDEVVPATKKKSRRGKRGGRRRSAARKLAESEIEPEVEVEVEAEPTEEAAPEKKKRSRRRRSAKQETVAEAAGAVVRVYELARELGVSSRDILEKCKDRDGFDLKSHMSTLTPEDQSTIRGLLGDADTSDETEAPAKKRSRRRRRGGRGRGGKSAPEESEVAADVETPPSDGEVKPKKKKRRRRGRSKTDDATDTSGAPANSNPASGEPAPAQSKRRTLYGGRRRISQAAREEAARLVDS